MYSLNAELDHNKPTRYSKLNIPIVIKPIYRKLLGSNAIAPAFLAQIIYWAIWAASKGLKEFYKSDQEFADELSVSLRTLQRAKSLLKKLGIISTRIVLQRGNNVTYYVFHSAKLEELITLVKNGADLVPTRQFGGLLKKSATRHFDVTQPANLAVSYIDTEITTEINKRNTSYFQKNNLLSNESGLGDLSYEQKPMSVEINLACSKEIILDQTPTLKTEQPIQEEKAVEPPPAHLKAEDVKALKKFKATKKATKVKPEKVIKTKIDRNLELTPERRQIGLNARFLNRGLLEGVIETEFESFVDYFTEKGTLRSDWDLSWKNWCKKAIELDKYNRKTTENPIRSGMTVPVPTEVKVSIDSAFVGFVKEKLNGMQFEFEGATYAEVDDRIVIDQQNSFRRDQIEKLKDRLQKYFGKEIELKWLRNSWVVPTVSKQETEIVAAEMTEIVTSDVSVSSPASLTLSVQKIPLETPPVFEASALPQESSDSSGGDVSSNYLRVAVQKRLAAARGYKNDSDNSISCEQDDSLTEKKNDKEAVENDSDENQFYPAEQSLAPKSVMIFSPVEADLAVDQLQPTEDVQENRSEISITQTCLELPNEISSKPFEEEIRFETRQGINNLPPPRTSNAIDLAISNAPIKLNKPKSALHLPKFPVTAAKSFPDSHSTAKSLSDCAEMININLANAKLRKEIPPELSKTIQESLIKAQCDLNTL